MRPLAGCVLLIVANLSAPSQAGTLDDPASAPEATLAWRLGFGAASGWRPGYTLTIGYRGLAPDRAPTRLLDLDVTDLRAAAHVAGMPIFQRDFSAYSEETATPAETPESKPWYARQWVWWTAGGIAAAVALTGAAGGSESEQHTLQIQDRGSGPATINGDLEDGYEVCAGGSDTCADVPGPGWMATAHGQLDRPDDSSWGAGTGGMGDLIAH
jgi:hypothetical protein